MPEVESFRTSSRTHFEVLGLGLEAQVFGLGQGFELKLTIHITYDSRLKPSIFGVNVVSDLVQVKENKVLYTTLVFAIFLAARNNLLKDFPWRYLFCHEINQF